MDNARMRGFAPQTVDKVERLLDLLDELGEHPLLRGKLALHGGTAINLCILCGETLGNMTATTSAV